MQGEWIEVKRKERVKRPKPEVEELEVFGFPYAPRHEIAQPVKRKAKKSSQPRLKPADGDFTYGTVETGPSLEERRQRRQREKAAKKSKAKEEKVADKQPETTHEQFAVHVSETLERYPHDHDVQCKDIAGYVQSIMVDVVQSPWTKLYEDSFEDRLEYPLSSMRQEFQGTLRKFISSLAIDDVLYFAEFIIDQAFKRPAPASEKERKAASSTPHFWTGLRAILQLLVRARPVDFANNSMRFYQRFVKNDTSRTHTQEIFWMFAQTMKTDPSVALRAWTGFGLHVLMKSENASEREHSLNFLDMALSAASPQKKSSASSEEPVSVDSLLKIIALMDSENDETSERLLELSEPLKQYTTRRSGATYYPTLIATAPQTDGQMQSKILEFALDCLVSSPENAQMLQDNYLGNIPATSLLCNYVEQGLGQGAIQQSQVAILKAHVRALKRLNASIARGKVDASKISKYSRTDLKNAADSVQALDAVLGKKEMGAAAKLLLSLLTIFIALLLVIVMRKATESMARIR